MIILREPEVVRGDVPGLLCRGMPLVYHGETDTPRDEPLRGVVVGIDPLDFAFVDYMPLPDGRTSKARTVAEVDSPESGMRRIVEVDWTSPAALDGALRWLADRGHICGWMRPRVYGGCIDDHGDLPAGTVSAILVARSVLEVAAGRPPVVDLLVETCWGTAGCVPGITRYWMRSKRDNAGKYCADVGRRRRSRVRIDERPARRADALSDGCALLVAGGVGLSHLAP